MPSRPLVLDANILIRAVLGQRVRRLLETYADNVSFFRLQPDDVRVDIVATWRKQEPSIALKLFIELLDEQLPAIRQKMRFT